MGRGDSFVFSVLTCTTSIFRLVSLCLAEQVPVESLVERLHILSGRLLQANLFQLAKSKTALIRDSVYSLFACLAERLPGLEVFPCGKLFQTVTLA